MTKRTLLFIIGCLILATIIAWPIIASLQIVRNLSYYFPSQVNKSQEPTPWQVGPGGRGWIPTVKASNHF